MVAPKSHFDWLRLAENRIDLIVTGITLPYAVLPALTFGAAHAPGAANSVIRSDAVIALGITCPDTNTVYPDVAVAPPGPNRWTLTSSGGTVAITGAVANRVNFEVVAGAGCYWQKVGTTLSPLTANDDVCPNGATSYLGLAADRWPNVYSVAGNFTGDITIGVGVGIIHADGVAAGQFLRADGTRYIPDTLAEGVTGRVTHAGVTTTIDSRAVVQNAEPGVMWSGMVWVNDT